MILSVGIFRMAGPLRLATLAYNDYLVDRLSRPFRFCIRNSYCVAQDWRTSYIPRASSMDIDDLSEHWCGCRYVEHSSPVLLSMEE